MKLISPIPVSSSRSTRQWVLNKGQGERGERREDREREDERKEERRIAIPGSSAIQADGESRVLRVPPGFHVPFYRQVSPALELRFLLSMQVSYHSHFILTDLSGNGSECFEGLWWS